MTVSLFDNQFSLEVPTQILFICFTRTPEIIEFCLQFSYDRTYVLTDKDSAYVTLNVSNNKWYTTDTLTANDFDHYDATKALLQFIHNQPKAYEYW